MRTNYGYQFWNFIRWWERKRSSEWIVLTFGERLLRFYKRAHVLLTKLKGAYRGTSVRSGIWKRFIDFYNHENIEHFNSLVGLVGGSFVRGGGTNVIWLKRSIFFYTDLSRYRYFQISISIFVFFFLSFFMIKTKEKKRPIYFQNLISRYLKEKISVCF